MRTNENVIQVSFESAAARACTGRRFSLTGRPGGFSGQKTPEASVKGSLRLQRTPRQLHRAPGKASRLERNLSGCTELHAWDYRGDFEGTVISRD